MIKIRCVVKIHNKEGLKRVGEGRKLWKYLDSRREKLAGHNLRHLILLIMAMERKIDGKNFLSGKRLHYIDQIVRDVGNGGSLRELHQTVQDIYECKGNKKICNLLIECYYSCVILKVGEVIYIFNKRLNQI